VRRCAPSPAPCTCVTTLATPTPLLALASPVFLTIDRSDEYQLINYILQFKSLQFITLGFLGTLVAVGQFYWCLTATPDRHSCDKNGPGLQIDFFYQFGAFWSQSFLSWIAFLMLPCSIRKGGSSSQEKVDEKASGGDTMRFLKGGYLRRMIGFDVAVFFLVFIWILVSATRPGVFGMSGEHWQFRATCYMAKTVYGLFSFPFLFFVIPPFNSILTHAIPTGYDEAGDCVRMLSSTQRLDKKRELGLLNRQTGSFSSPKASASGSGRKSSGGMRRTSGAREPNYSGQMV